DWAHELCGGTHAQRSGQLGVITFLGEGSIGAGVRRVEAYVGADAYQFLAREHTLVSRLTELVKAPAEELVERIERTISSLKEAERDLAKVRSAQLSASVDGILGEGRDIGSIRVWTYQAPDGTSANDLRELAAKAKGRVPPQTLAVQVGLAVADGKVAIITTASDGAITKGITARGVLQAALPALDGRGGGKDDMAQGGCSKVTGIPDAFAAVEALIAQKASA
ncbi:MAG: DHHA1 domain-containing protein, partial [Actinomycetales bacterium]